MSSSFRLLVHGKILKWLRFQFVSRYKWLYLFRRLLYILYLSNRSLVFQPLSLLLWLIFILIILHFGLQPLSNHFLQIFLTFLLRFLVFLWELLYSRFLKHSFYINLICIFVIADSFSWAKFNFLHHLLNSSQLLLILFKPWDKLHA